MAVALVVDVERQPDRGMDTKKGEDMTSTTSRILQDVAHHYNHLIVEHQKLDKEVTKLHDTYQPDHVIKAAKLNKLHIKQEI